MGKIFYIMGKSSSGKDTIFKRLQKEFPEFRTIVLYTTRPVRSGERNGTEYFFVSEDRLQELLAAGRVMELREYHTQLGIWKYFTVDDGQIDLERYDYFLMGTLKSYEDLKEYFTENPLVPIYIEVDDGERLQRALDRERTQDEPKYAEMCRRFLADSADFSEENLKRAGITKRFRNEDLECCVKEIEGYIRENIPLSL